MFTKRVRIVYAFLFLFAFAFALSFTLASQAQAQGGCCAYFDCPGHPEYQSGWGHWKMGAGCVLDLTDPCDIPFKSCP